MNSVGIFGGLPPALGAGGLDVRMGRTTKAIAERGLNVSRIEADPASTEYDVIHGFGSDGNTWAPIMFRTRSDAPLVLSPVLITGGTTFDRLRQQLYARVTRGPQNVYAMRRDILRRADALIALTQHERQLLARDYGIPADLITVIPNGTDALAELSNQYPGQSHGEIVKSDSDGHLLVVGNISERKRQADLLHAINGKRPITFAGAYHADAPRDVWEDDVSRLGSEWLGEVRERSTMLDLYRKATALVLPSTAEGYSNAVIDALAIGLPVIVSDLASHREMAAAWPELVHIAANIQQVEQLAVEIERQGSPGLPANPVPTWSDIASRTVDVYDRAIGAKSNHHNESRTACAH